MHRLKWIIYGVLALIPAAYGTVSTKFPIAVPVLWSQMEATPSRFTVSTTVNFNSANTDFPLTITLPAGYTRYLVSVPRISGASASITTATFGLFTGAGATGTAIITSGTVSTVSTASDNTNNNAQIPGTNNAGTESYNVGTLYFRVQTPQGSAATGSFSVDIIPAP